MVQDFVGGLVYFFYFCHEVYGKDLFVIRERKIINSSLTK